MDELLIDYLLNALDPDAVRELEERLHAEPVLLDRLTSLKKTIALLALDGDVPEAPPQLVVSTLACVAAERCARPAPAPPLSVRAFGTAPGRRWFRRIDVLVAACLMIVVGALGVSFLGMGWQNYERAACRENLKVFWDGLDYHSQNHDGASRPWKRPTALAPLPASSCRP